MQFKFIFLDQSFFEKKLAKVFNICYNSICSDERYTPGWCNGSTSDSGSFGLGSSPSPGAKWRYGQAAKTSPSQGEITGSIPVSATIVLYILILKSTDKFPCLTSILRTNKSNKVFFIGNIKRFRCGFIKIFFYHCYINTGLLILQVGFFFLGESKSSAAINGTAFKVYSGLS